MEELLKKQQKLRFSGSGASHQNGAGSERAINTVVNMASSILMQAWIICQKDTLSIDFSNGNRL